MAAAGEGGDRRRLARRGLAGGAALALAVLLGCAFVWRGELWRTALDPREPYPTYRPPAAPDYAAASSWALRPADPARAVPGEPPSEVFFLHPTTYPGGRDWNAPLHDPQAEAFLQRVALPNYAGPFQRVGRVWAPRYRAASLFTYLSLRDDARDARRFAYRDVRSAFDAFLRQAPAGRPLVLAGAGQGAELLARLLQDWVERDPALVRRVAAVYLMDAAEPVDVLPRSGPLSPCRTRGEAGCTVAWLSAPADDPGRAERRLQRALAWTADGRLANLEGRAIVCVDPVTGGTDRPAASARESRGAANATGLEWGARPAFLAHQVSASCSGGVLRTTAPAAASLQRRGGWLDRRRIAPFNLFYADLEADAQARVEAWSGGGALYGSAAPPITGGEAVGRAAVHRID